MMYMSYWYGALYVVVEDWKELNLSDSIIDEMLKSNNVELLRRYHNGVFHFQKDYLDNRFIGIMKDGENAVKWVRNLNNEFGRYFLEKFNDWKKDS